MNEINVRQRFTALRNRTGLSMDQFAKEIGYAGSSSIQRYEENGDYEERSLPHKLITKMLATLIGKGTPPITAGDIYMLSYIGEGDMASTRWTGPLKFNKRQQPIPSQPSRDGLDEPPVEDFRYSNTLPVKGEVRAGAWLETDDQWQHDDSTIPVGPDPRYPVAQYALKVVGDSMNKVFPEGQYVVCASLVEMGRDAQHGDLVIVERRRGGLIEVTVKRFDMSGNEPVLRPESTNEAYTPVRINEQSQDTEIFITGLVVGRYEQF